MTDDEGSDAHRVIRQAKASLKPIDPRGTSIIVGGRHAGQRDEGCEVSRYHNEIPPEVALVVRAQHARGFTEPLWQIQGVETPIGPDGEGVPEVWTTEPFAIVP